MKKVLLSILICGTFAFAKQHTTHTHAFVTHSEAVYEYRHNKRDYQRYDDSYENNRYRNNYNSSYSNNNTIGLDTIVGGTIGVIIGNQIGRGNGKTAAKIVGGLLGAAVANNTRYDRNDNYSAQTDYVRYDNYKSRNRKVLVGYRNYFIYKNKEFYKFSKHRKNRIRITETINF
ncbi:MAG: glycine zipper 2TM domain-containing protein [Poseidonibacter sp.]